MALHLDDANELLQLPASCLTDTGLINVLEAVGAHMWPTREIHRGPIKNWTCQIISGKNKVVVQPTRATWRAAAVDALDEWRKLDT